MILMIDNFDSFTYNLVQLFGELGREVRVFRNNAITPEEAEALKPEYIIISPGPCTPEKAGVSISIINHFAGKVPVLGVCLGHQAIGAAFGGRIVKADRLMHGKNSDILHDNKTLFSDLPQPFSATRYHSLIIDRKSLPDCLEVSAWTADGEIMGVRHRRYEVEGLQFHPESVATKLGRKIIENFLGRTRKGVGIDLKLAITRVVGGQDLSGEEMTAVMRIIMEGEATPAQIGAFLTALRLKGETPEEIGAAAAVMREKATRVSVAEGTQIVDTCGTGGDGAHTFNISTASALIASGAGVTVAKHGNRAVSSRCGSADVLQELGLNIAIPAARMAECIARVGIGFLFAPTLHAAMKHVIEPRREIGIRTLFNILGPLANPALANAQVLGVYDRNLVHTMAQVLKDLGLSRALVVHGSDGLDEITLTGITYLTELREGELIDRQIDPRELGLSLCTVEALKSESVEENARILLDILSGKERGPKRDIALLNGAAAITVAGKAEDLSRGLELARQSVDTGAALKKLELLIEVSREH